MSTPVNIETLKKTLEKDGLAHVKALQQKTGSILLPEKELLGIMKNGADTFKAQVGRNMSYSEMREMYG